MWYRQCIFRRSFPASSFLCSAAPELEIPAQVQICRHFHDMCAQKRINKKIKTWISQAVWRNLTCGILLPSAPQRHDQWGPRCSAAAPWVQSVRREDWLRKTREGDGSSVDSQSPSGWDEVHQRGEWTHRQQTARSFSRSVSWWGVFFLP